MKKRWTDLTVDCNNEVAKMRYAFLKEHENADVVVCNRHGVPIQAIYYTPELPDYGKTRDDVPMSRPPILNIKFDDALILKHECAVLYENRITGEKYCAVCGRHKRSSL